MLLGLRSRIYLLLVSLVCVIIIGSGATIWYAQRSQNLQAEMIDGSIEALKAVNGLTSSLMAQKGMATYFFLSGDEAWLEQLNNNHEAFKNWLSRAREVSPLDEERNILNTIESLYIHYAYSREQVITHYKEGRREDGARLHWKIRDQFLNIINLCDTFRQIHVDDIAAHRETFFTESRLISWLALAGLILSSSGVVLLSVTLFRQILDPIRRLARSPHSTPPQQNANDVKALDHKVRSLIHDVSEAQKQLDASRETLMQSEKLALVGKLAAGVAHSVRNPLTSVKMRLFSLERSLQLNEQQEEDFEVVNEEIVHIDNIMKNFLEFARRPKLRPQMQSPSEVVDLAVRLLRHKLESHNIQVIINREKPLPEMAIDGNQLKEVLVNLLLNACDVLVQDGTITISEGTEIIDPMGEMVLVRIADNGPGIPQDIAHRVFDPFFSTKEEGSGLGLAIARRVVEEHGGWLHVRSGENGGAVFVVALPGDRRKKWLESSS